MSKQRNFVHKNALQFQKASVFTDRKKAKKKGYQKHKPSKSEGFLLPVL